MKTYGRVEVQLHAFLTSLSSSRLILFGYLHFLRTFSVGSRGSFPGGKMAGAWRWPLTSI